MPLGNVSLHHGTLNPEYKSDELRMRVPGAVTVRVVGILYSASRGAAPGVGPAVTREEFVAAR